MKEIKTWIGLKKGDNLLFKSGKGIRDYFGVVTELEAKGIRIEFIQISMRGKRDTALMKANWFGDKDTYWKAYKMNKKEKEDCKIKLAMEKI